MQAWAGESKPLNILLIEDDAIEVMKFNRVLANLHQVHKIIEANNGEEALEILKNKVIIPDIIVLDLNMPKINGFETTKLIRNKGYTIPIIAVTAFEKEEVQERAKLSGIDDIIAKPFDTRKLFQMIRFHINLKEKEQV